ncbi:MAG: fasciclin domain-containing protein [Cyclobacteriaceae bacterium]|nr:fasciclin domain-containing protein [Cyclobacteriaceae bacterium]
MLILIHYSCIPLDKEVPPDPRTFDPPDTNLRQLSSSLPYFKDYLQAMDHINLTDFLEGDGPFTVFMPNQLAFTRFRINNEISSAEQIPDDKLKNILLYHIIPGHWTLLQIPGGYYPTYAIEQTTSNPIDLFIDSNDLFRLNGIVAMDEPDLETINGVIHSISEVLTIPTVMTHLSVNRELSMIYDILNSDYLDQELQQQFHQDIPFTFLAPTNLALEMLLEEHEEWQSYKDIPRETLKNILAYHLVTGNNLLLKNILEDRMISTLNGTSFTIEPEFTGWVIRDRFGTTARVTINDIQAVNGVIHSVDRVLMP